MNTEKTGEYEVIKFMKELDTGKLNSDAEWILSKLEEISKKLK